MEAPIAAPYEALLKIIFFLDLIRARRLIVRTLETPRVIVRGASKSCQQQHWDTISLGVALSYLLIIPSRVTLSIASRGYAFSGLCKSFGEPKAGNGEAVSVLETKAASKLPRSLPRITRKDTTYSITLPAV